MLFFTPIFAVQTDPGYTYPTTNQVVPFLTTDSQLIVPTTINGRPLNMVFDTGFGGYAITDTSVDLGKPTGKTTLVDFVGTVEADTFAIKKLLMGTVNFDVNSDWQVFQQDMGVDLSSSMHADGLMGLSVILNRVSQINFQNKQFRFYPDSVDISKWVPDNKRTFLVPMLPIGSRAINLLVKTPTGGKMIMTLDTGNAFYATTYTDSLAREGLWAKDQKPKFSFLSGVASGAVESFAKTMTNMTIFGSPVPNSQWDVINQPSAESTSDGTVGFQFLKNFNITFDFKRRLVWFENFTGKTSDPPVGGTGLSGFYSSRAKAVVAALIAPDSPADKAGIKKGDLILQIDEDDPGHVSYDRLNSLLNGPVGSKVKISFSDNGLVKRVTLVRADLSN